MHWSRNNALDTYSEDMHSLNYTELVNMQEEKDMCIDIII